MFRPERALRSWTWTPSTPRPDASVTVPETAPVVTPWAAARTGDRASNARAATAPTSGRIRNTNALLEGKGDGKSTAPQASPARENQSLAGNEPRLAALRHAVVQPARSARRPRPDLGGDHALDPATDIEVAHDLHP